MNYKILFKFAFIVMPILSFSQTVITGRVIDSDTKKPIKEVTVLLEGTDIKTTTNVLGYFQLTIDSTSTIIFKHEGYEPGQVKAPKQNNIQIQLYKDLTPEGTELFYKSIAKKISYPSQARSMGTEGRVYVSFDVDSLKGIQNIKILQDIGDNCGQEVVRVLERSNHKWVPKAKSATLILAVTFRISNSKALEYLSPPGTDIVLPRGKLLSEVIVTAYTTR